MSAPGWRRGAPRAAAPIFTPGAAHPRERGCVGARGAAPGALWLPDGEQKYARNCQRAPSSAHVKDGPVRRNDYRTAAGAFSTLYFRIIALSADCTSICSVPADFSNFAPPAFLIQWPSRCAFCFNCSLIRNRKKHPAARSREHISQGHLRTPFAKGEGCV